MQKKNPVIKNYIMSSKKRILHENPLYSKPIYSETLLYRLFLEQNKGSFYFFLLRK